MPWLSRSAAAALAAAILAAAPPARAQPVNAEVLQTDLFEEDWSGSLTGSFSVARGNVELLDVGAAGHVRYQTFHPVPEVEEGETEPLPFLRQRVFLRLSGRIGARADEKFINQGFAHLRWSGMFHPRVGPDLFTQAQFNEFQRLRLRVLYGAGARVAIVHVPAFLLWGATGYMYERERIDVQEGAPDAPRTSAHRWASYLTARASLAEGGFVLQNTIFIQPRFDATGDIRVLEELEIVAKVTDLFSLGTTLSLLHDTEPPTGVKKTDLRLGTTLTLTL